MGNQPPCAVWAEKLALRHEDLSPADRAALEAHVRTCPACEATRADYRFLDARLVTLPLPSMQPLPRLFPRLTLKDEGENEEAEMANAVGFMRSPLRDQRIMSSPRRTAPKSRSGR